MQTELPHVGQCQESRLLLAICSEKNHRAHHTRYSRANTMQADLTCRAVPCRLGRVRWLPLETNVLVLFKSQKPPKQC